jgi:hypothetical protein
LFPAIFLGYSRYRISVDHRAGVQGRVQKFFADLAVRALKSRSRRRQVRPGFLLAGERWDASCDLSEIGTANGKYPDEI